jgi:copper chaperone CopZ
MTHTYIINGATCGGCLKTISAKIMELPEVDKIQSIDLSSITIVLKSHLDLVRINESLIGTRYSLSNEQMLMPKITPSTISTVQPEKPTFADYVPLIVVFSYIIIGSLILTRFFGLTSSQMVMGDGMVMDMTNPLMTFMNNLMGLWFVIFAMFKLFDLRGFAEGYSMYDVIAKKWFGWGYVYPFVEVALGLAYLLNFQMAITNIITLVLMVIGAIGIGLKLSKKEKFQCACLGTIFKIPLTQISLYEDIFMAVMALGMIFGNF